MSGKSQKHRNERIEKSSARPAPTDKELAERFLAGERDAYNELYRRHVAAAYKQAHRILGHDADAEDAVQEAFINASNGLDGFQWRSTFKTWLMRLVFNAAIDIRRWQRPRRAAEERRKPGEDRAARRRQEQPRPPLDTLLAEEWRELVHRTLRGYATFWERLVWNLRLREGMTYPEIAGIFEGMPAEKPRNIVRKLCGILEEHLPQPEWSVH